MISVWEKVLSNVSITFFFASRANHHASISVTCVSCAKFLSKVDTPMVFFPSFFLSFRRASLTLLFFISCHAFLNASR